MSTAEHIDPSAQERERPGDEAQADRAPRSGWRTNASVWAGVEDGLSPVEVELLRPIDRSTHRNTEAEYALYRVHGRFLGYLEAYLSPWERILAFTSWSEGAMRRAFGARVRSALAGSVGREGVLLVTDRQILLMSDDSAAHRGTVLPGYRVQTTAYERLAAIDIERVDARRLVLRMVLEASGEREVVELAFAERQRCDIEQIGGLLAGFVPTPTTVSPRVPGRIVANADAIAGAGEIGGGFHDETRSAFDRWIGQHLDPGGAPRRIHAVAPGFDAAGKPLAIAMTQEHLLLMSQADATAPTVIPLSRVTSLRTRHSVLGQEIAWTVGSTSRATIHFAPVSGAAAVAMFQVARWCMTMTPAEHSGPELSAERESGRLS